MHKNPKLLAGQQAADWLQGIVLALIPKRAIVSSTHLDVRETPPHTAPSRAGIDTDKQLSDARARQSHLDVHGQRLVVRPVVKGWICPFPENITAYPHAALLRL